METIERIRKGLVEDSIVGLSDDLKQLLSETIDVILQPNECKLELLCTVFLISVVLPPPLPSPTCLVFLTLEVCPETGISTSINEIAFRMR